MKPRAMTPSGDLYATRLEVAKLIDRLVDVIDVLDARIGRIEARVGRIESKPFQLDE